LSDQQDMPRPDAVTSDAIPAPPPAESNDPAAGSGGSAPTLVNHGPGGARRMIGRYRIKGLIASGGMGAVYLAVQEQPKRTVAVKVIRAGLASPAALRRFEYESQVLARMRHPGIAQIYEAGTYASEEAGEQGTPVPYFAMEYIPDALTLREYAERRRLDVRQRLGLFIKVCDAVQYGHTKGIIHRDLKPANILVDGSGWPKIIDFGVARGVDSDMAGATLQTNMGQLVGTPQYISPEQCSGDPHAIDVRSDVYSLGVVLHELLSGKFPYDIGTGNIYEAARHVCEDPPVRLGVIDPQFRGDIETIVLKALEKERERRYQSVADLQEDIERHLRVQPIMARPLGPIGRAGKWVRRNRQLTAVAGIALVVLSTVSTVLIVRIISAERKATANLKMAEQNLRAARQNFELVRSMLEFKDENGASRVRSGLVDVEKLLDDAADNLERKRPELASTEADFREILGVSYTGLHKLLKARQHLARVVDIRRAALPTPDTPDAALADAIHNLAAAMYWDGDYQEAYSLYQSSLEMRQRLHEDELAGAGGDKTVAAIAGRTESGNATIAFSLTHLAACAIKLGRLDEAQAQYEQALAIRQRIFGNRHPQVAASLNNIAKLWMEREDYRTAEDYYRRSLTLITELTEGRGSAGAGPDITVSHATHNLAGCLLAQDRHAEARQLFARALEIRRRILPDDHPFVGASRLGLARAALGMGETALADAEARAALAIYRARLRDDHPDLADALECLGHVYFETGELNEAATLFRQAVSTGRSGLRPVSEQAEALLSLGRALAAQAQTGAAESALLEAKQLLGKPDNSPSPRRMRIAQALLALYEQTGQTEKRDALARQLGDRG
jgi:eukaryotic-like serine/threonine-protein kinase